MQLPASDFFALSADDRREVHFELCAHALRRWNEYAAEIGRLSYSDSVVGVYHKVDLTLPRVAFASARAGSDESNVEERYDEPIVAMQDFDLELPKEIEFAYYAVYNLFMRYALHDKIDDWLIVNQALSCEKDENQWTRLLEDAIENTKS